MLVCQQQRGAESTHCRKNVSGPPRSQLARLHRTFECCENHNQKRPDTMLQHVGRGKTLPKGTWPKRPVLRVSAQQDEDGQTSKAQRPKASPAHGAAPAEQRQQPCDEHNQPCPVVVVLRPCFVGVVAPDSSNELTVLDRHCE